MPFAKLDRNFCDSSILAHGPEVAGVWAYLLAAANSTGCVTATVPAMAGAFRIAEARLLTILRVLEEPDPWSRTPENDGRRIRIEREPEWHIVLLNHAKYMVKEHTNDPDARRKYMREYMKAKRQAKAAAGRVNSDVNSDVNSVNSVRLTVNTYREGEGDITTDNGLRPPAAVSTVNTVKAWTAEAVDDWNARFGDATAQPGRIGKAMKPLVDRYTWEVVRPAWQRYLSEKDGEFASPQDFAAKLALWLGKRVGTGKGEQFVNRTKAVLTEWLEKRSSHAE